MLRIRRAMVRIEAVAVEQVAVVVTWTSLSATMLERRSRWHRSKAAGNTVGDVAQAVEVGVEDHRRCRAGPGVESSGGDLPVGGHRATAPRRLP